MGIPAQEIFVLHRMSGPSHNLCRVFVCLHCFGDTIIYEIMDFVRTGGSHMIGIGRWNHDSFASFPASFRTQPDGIFLPFC
jgi:hypothetical protein